MSVSGVDEITSTSAENVSTIQITYLEGTDPGHRRHQAAGAV